MYQIVSKSGKSFSVRPPRASDLYKMLEYINTLGKEDIYINANPQDLYTLTQEEAYLNSVLLKISLNQEVHLLAFDKTTLIGSVTLTRQDKRRRHIGVFGITLASNYRQEGLGFQLATLALTQAQKKIGITLATLTVFADNKPALALYHKLGFKKYGQLPQGLNYKSSFIDEIFMYLPLT